MFRAEEAFSKAYLLRRQKGATYEERLKLYARACNLFLKAHQYSDRTFTLNRIASAAESCMRVGNYEAEERFREFEESYIKVHPNEAEYGDAVPLMGLE